MYFFILGQNVRKKIIGNILKYFKEISKNLELKMNSYTKNYSKIPNLKVDVIKFDFVNKIYDFVQKVFEIKMEKADEILNFIK